MSTESISHEYYSNESGVTLVELLVVIVVLGIVSSIAVISINGVIEKTKREVCHLNVTEVEERYERYLVVEEVDHSMLCLGSLVRDIRMSFVLKMGGSIM